MADIKLVIHCADIHIRNVQRHEEYAQQLERFVEKCKEIAAPYDKDEVRIVIAGDLVHSKNQISNELIVFASVFLRKLEQIAKVIVISGNHDLVVDNQSRTDTLTALFETARFSNCYFFDKMLGYKSGCITDSNIVWALYSIYDGLTQRAETGLCALSKNIEKKAQKSLGYIMEALLVQGFKTEQSWITD